MDSDSPSWYIPGEGKQPTGPFTAEQIAKSWRAGRITEKTVCWREGMPKWLPLAQVEPFASTIYAEKEAAGRAVVRRRLIAAAALACITIAGVFFYVYWKEATTLHEANHLIAVGNYTEAVSLLGKFRGNTYFYRKETEYLLALATVCQCASATDANRLSEDKLKELTKQWKSLFLNGERWRERAKSDLAEIVGSVPKKAPDALARAAALAGFLQELKLAEDKALAKQLLATMKAGIDSGHAPEDADAAAVEKILRLDPKLADDVVALVFPPSEESPQSVEESLRLLKRWASKQPTLAEPLALALVERGDDITRAGRYRSINLLLLDSAEEICPGLRTMCAQKRLAWLKLRRDDKDHVGVARYLDGIRIGDDGAIVSAEAAALYLQVAEGLCKFDRAIAARALDRAFHLDPELADSEANAFLWLDLHPEQSDEKLQRCEGFLTEFPKSEHCNDVRRTILAIADRRAEAVKPARPDKAIAIAVGLLQTRPEPEMKREIEGKLAEWRNRSERHSVVNAETNESGRSITEQKVKPPQPKTLTGTWKASGGASFSITDDGKTATVTLKSSGNLRALNGTLTRSTEKADSDSLIGTFSVLFVVIPRKYEVRVIVAMLDANQLRVECKNWPLFDERTGKFTGSRGPLTETWNRMNNNSADVVPWGNPFAPR